MTKAPFHSLAWIRPKAFPFVIVHPWCIRQTKRSLLLHYLMRTSPAPRLTIEHRAADIYIYAAIKFIICTRQRLSVTIPTTPSPRLRWNDRPYKALLLWMRHKTQSLDLVFVYKALATFGFDRRVWLVTDGGVGVCQPYTVLALAIVRKKVGVWGSKIEFVVKKSDGLLWLKTFKRPKPLSSVEVSIILCFNMGLCDWIARTKNRNF